MKPLLALMLILAATFAISAAESDSIPPASLLAEISLGAGPGWSLRIAPDGSGQIGYGCHAPDFATVPAGTFDFQSVYDSLLPVVQRTGNMREFFTVAFHQRGVTATYAQYTRREDIVLPLFTAAKGKCGALGCRRINELWSKSPPSLHE